MTGDKIVKAGLAFFSATSVIGVAVAIYQEGRRQGFKEAIKQFVKETRGRS